MKESEYEDGKIAEHMNIHDVRCVRILVKSR